MVTGFKLSRKRVQGMKPTFFRMSTIMAFFAQLALFSVATAALTLLYRSYQNDDFLQSFIVIGMILTLPWLTISLLPTICALRDQELRRQLLWGQLATMVIIFALFLGASVLMGVDTVIITALTHWIDGYITEIPEIIDHARAGLEAVFQAAVSFFNNLMRTLIP